MNREPIVYTVIRTPLGPAVAAASSGGCCLFEFLTDGHDGTAAAHVSRRLRTGCPEGENAVLKGVRKEIGEYFSGVRRDFTVPLDPAGTAFQRKVWEELLKIPFGETRSYGEIARTLGMPGASRAVGTANGMNPIAVMIPCHRVIREGGGLGGYAGGIGKKKFLLTLEGAGATRSKEGAGDSLFAFA